MATPRTSARSRRGNSALAEVEGQRNEAFVEDQAATEPTEGVSELANTLLSIESTMKHHLEKLAARKAELVEAAQAVKAAVASAATIAMPLPAPVETPQLRQRSAKSARSTRRLSVIVDGTVAKEPPVAPRRTDKVVVKVRTIFLKVGEIDTMKDRFAADVFVQAKWREPLLDNQLEMKNATIDWDKYWDPKLSIENAYGDTKEMKWRTLTFDHQGIATVVEKRRFNGAFLEYMELNDFPFDLQDLTVTLTTTRDENEVEFIEDPREPSVVNVGSFVDEQEWNLYQYINTWSAVTEESNKAGSARHPTFSAAAKASRRPGFFIWNILVVMFMICSMSFCTFSVGSTLPQNRLQLSFILLLTNVSFKFVVNQSLPMISYLTILDKYILSSMGILCFVCVWHAMIAKMIYECTTTENRTAASCTEFRGPITTSDNAALGVLSFIYFMFHVIFIIIISKLLKEHAKYSSVSSRGKNRRMSLEDSGIIPDLFDDLPASKSSNSSNQSGNSATVYAANQNSIISAS